MSNDYYESHRGEWQWQDGEYTVTRTTAWSGPGCHDGCGVLYYTKDGKLEKMCIRDRSGAERDSRAVRVRHGAQGGDRRRQRVRLQHREP